ncbi:hypothetical protein COT72_01330 [archaeon CG10_big_fil_rev_8_21_14_0_10_43_11]|nr:MAG: hypothetical protein COT72_01330 [archaeon CG10_big_fil_rev_8_21_14_0_10_43_11]
MVDINTFAIQVSSMLTILGSSVSIPLVLLALRNFSPSSVRNIAIGLAVFLVSMAVSSAAMGINHLIPFSYALDIWHVGAFLGLIFGAGVGMYAAYISRRLSKV